MTTPTSENQRNPDNPGPSVIITIEGDGHFEPDTHAQLNLGLENFSNWDTRGFDELRGALTKVADREVYTGHGENRSKVRCNEQAYFDGVAEYLAQIEKLGVKAPCDKALISSVFYHCIDSYKSELLQEKMGMLLCHPNKEIKSAALSALHYEVSLYGDATFYGPRHILFPPLSPLVTNQIASAIPTFDDEGQAQLMKILNNLGTRPGSKYAQDPRDAALLEDVSEKVLKLASKSTCQAFINEAVEYLYNPKDPKLADLMTKCLAKATDKMQGPSTNTFALGLAYGYLLDKDPMNSTIRQGILDRLKIADRYNRDYLSGLVRSHTIPALRLATEDYMMHTRKYDINPRELTTYFGESLLSICKNLLFIKPSSPEAQQKEDLNVVLHHLRWTMGPTYVPEMLIDALVATGSEPGIKFLKEQLKNPSTPLRERYIRSAFNKHGIDVS